MTVMNPLSHYPATLKAKRQAKAVLKRLRASMRPDPTYRENRLRQFSQERRERYWRNVGMIGNGR